MAPPAEVPKGAGLGVAWEGSGKDIVACEGERARRGSTERGPL